MMKHVFFIGLFVTLLGTGAGAQGAKPAQGAETRTPKQQPTTAAPPAVPAGEMALGTINLGRAVKADGKPLARGTYTVRLTGQTATPEAKGETPSAERWVEFVRGGKVVGREVVTIVPQSEIGLVQKDTPPARNGAKVETLKGGDYVRVWINRNGNHYLIHLPAEAA